MAMALLPVIDFLRCYKFRPLPEWTACAHKIDKIEEIDECDTLVSSILSLLGSRRDRFLDI
jgi:hypothetical protein